MLFVIVFERSIYIHLFTSFRNLTFMDFNARHGAHYSLMTDECIAMDTVHIRQLHPPEAPLMLPFATTLVTAVPVLSYDTVVSASLKFCTDRISITF